MGISIPNIIQKPKYLSLIKLNNVSLAIFAFAFIAADVLVPYALHQFGIAGRVFQPMFFLVLIPALLFGMRMGLLVGFVTPIMSFLFSGMPLPNILPLVLIEITALGIFAGLFREKYRMNIFLSLILSIISAKLVLGLSVLFMASIVPAGYFLDTFSIGWPGLLLQIIFIPLAVRLIYGRIQSRA
jgi:hypothetical protein